MRLWKTAALVGLLATPAAAEAQISVSDDFCIDGLRATASSAGPRVAALVGPPIPRTTPTPATTSYRLTFRVWRTTPDLNGYPVQSDERTVYLVEHRGGNLRTLVRRTAGLGEFGLVSDQGSMSQLPLSFFEGGGADFRLKPIYRLAIGTLPEEGYPTDEHLDRLPQCVISGSVFGNPNAVY